jgi:hypothetical protein
VSRRDRRQSYALRAPEAIAPLAAPREASPTSVAEQMPAAATETPLAGDVAAREGDSPLPAAEAPTEPVRVFVARVQINAGADGFFRVGEVIPERAAQAMLASGLRIGREIEER